MSLPFQTVISTELHTNTRSKMSIGKCPRNHVIELSIFSIMEKNVQKAFLHDLFALVYLLLLGFIFCCLF